MSQKLNLQMVPHEFVDPYTGETHTLMVTEKQKEKIRKSKYNMR